MWCLAESCISDQIERCHCEVRPHVPLAQLLVPKRGEPGRAASGSRTLPRCLCSKLAHAIGRRARGAAVDGGSGTDPVVGEVRPGMAMSRSPPRLNEIGIEGFLGAERDEDGS